MVVGDHQPHHPLEAPQQGGVRRALLRAARHLHGQDLLEAFLIDPNARQEHAMLLTPAPPAHLQVEVGVTFSFSDRYRQALCSSSNRRAMRLTASLSTFTRLSASVTSAILRPEILERYSSKTAS